MRNFGTFILASRRNAIVTALLLCLLPYVGGIAQVIMALVTLRKGIREGFLVCLWISLPIVVLGLSGQPQFLITALLLTNVLTWLLAATLARTGAWTTVIEIGALLGLLVVLLLHVTLPDIQQYWSITLKQNLLLLQGDASTMPSAFSEDVLVALLPYATGLCWLAYLLGALFTLLAARWWELAMGHKPILADELKKIRLSKVMLFTFAAIALTASLGSRVAQDMVPLTIVVFLLAGLSLSHHWLSHRKPFWLWISSFYALGIFFLPVPIIIICIAVVDSLFNFRHRGKQRGSYLTKKST